MLWPVVFVPSLHAECRPKQNSRDIAVQNLQSAIKLYAVAKLALNAFHRRPDPWP